MRSKITAVANDSDIDSIINSAPIENIHFIDRITEITEQIYRLLEKKDWKQKDLATKMNKSEAEISKWLSGTHNLTIRTIAHMESILEENIILTEAGMELKAEKEFPSLLIKSQMYKAGARLHVEADKESSSCGDEKEVLQEEPQLPLAA